MNIEETLSEILATLKRIEAKQNRPRPNYWPAPAYPPYHYWQIPQRPYWWQVTCETTSSGGTGSALGGVTWTSTIPRNGMTSGVAPECGGSSGAADWSY